MEFDPNKQASSPDEMYTRNRPSHMPSSQHLQNEASGRVEISRADDSHMKQISSLSLARASNVSNPITHEKDASPTRLKSSLHSFSRAWIIILVISAITISFSFLFIGLHLNTTNRGNSIAIQTSPTSSTFIQITVGLATATAVIPTNTITSNGPPKAIPTPTFTPSTQGVTYPSPEPYQTSTPQPPTPTTLPTTTIQQSPFPISGPCVPGKYVPITIKDTGVNPTPWKIEAGIPSEGSFTFSPSSGYLNSQQSVTVQLDGTNTPGNPYVAIEIIYSNGSSLFFEYECA